MSNPDPVDGRCNAKTRDGGYCANYPKGSADRCRMHGADSTPGPGAEEENTNAVKHNITADVDLLYGRLPDPLKERVDRWKDDLLADVAEAQGFGDSADDCPSYIEPHAHRVAMNMLKVTHFLGEWQSNPDALDSNIDSDSPLVNAAISDFSEGGLVIEVEGDVAEQVAGRLSNENRQWLKEFGVLDGPTERAAENISRSLAEVLKE